MKQLLFIPGPVGIAEPVLAAMARPMINHRGPEFARLLERLERRLRPVFGTSSDVLLLGGSGTSGLEAAIASAFSPGDRVLSCPIGVFGRRFGAIAKAHGLQVDVLETPVGRALDADALRERLDGDRARPYTGILLTQNETSTGAQNDMAALAQAIGDYPALVLVDAISGLAASDFRMDEWRFDVVVAASQKALAAPPGLAMVAVNQRAWDRIARARCARFYLDLLKARESARAGESPWTPPVPIAFALDAALDAYEAAGPVTVWARHERYARAIRAACEALRLELLSAPGAHSRTVVAILVPEGIESATLSRELREEHGIVLGGGQMELKGRIWRMGTMGDLSEIDIVGALGTIERVLHHHGHAVQVGTASQAALEVFSSRDRPLGQVAASRTVA